MQAAHLVLREVNELLEQQSRRIAQCVHDEAGQLLAGVFILLDQAAHELAPACGPCFQEIRQLLEQVENQLREISHDLYPSVLDDLGLLPALELLIDRAAKRSGLTIVLEKTVEPQLNQAIETALYRFVQEALTNIGKHARARRVTVRLSRAEGICCSVKDDGVGFDVGEILSRKGARGLGLLGIRERVQSLGGSVAIRSLPGWGTEISATIPCEI